MLFTINVEKPKDLHAIFARAKNDANEQNILYEGDSHSGHFSGYGFEGTYAVDIDYITFAVSKKPWFVTKARFEKEIGKYLLSDIS